jgi:4-amino-4-deoxy-L-arabinose transferase-like glycosyltransferase
MKVQDKGGRGGIDWLTGILLLVSVLFYAVGFVHLRADFPNGSPWMDWSKMTDEGWYGGAAIHHFVQGNWYLPGSFNPAIAMPVWPVMLWGWFSLTGVSMLAARTLTMLLYGVSLVLLYRVAWRARPGRLAAVVVLLTVINPFCYAFNRLAVLEPVTVFWMMLALWLAGGAAAANPQKMAREVGRGLLLGVVIFLLVLTKVTGVAVVPAVLYLVWAGWGWPGWQRVRTSQWMSAAVIVIPAAVLWEAYLRLLVRPRYLADYRLLFSINAYRVHLSIVPKMAWVTLRDGGWFSVWLFPLALLIGVLSLVWLRELWRVPLFGAAVIAIVGHLAYIGYHTNFQPRYYEVIAMPLMLVIGVGVAAMWDRRGQVSGRWGMATASGVTVVAALMMMGQTVVYVLHPEYSYWEAAQGVAAIVTADGTGRPILSDSGDDLTLWTGVPAICEGYTTQGLDAVLQRYRPGWFAAWPGWEDKEITQVGERYRLDAVARYRVFDDPKRQMLVLYKLTPR